MKNILFLILLIPFFGFSQTGNPRTVPTKPFCVFYKNGKLAYLAPGSNGQVLKMQSDTSVYWAADATGSVTDGTYGEITVTGSNWTINNNAVTSAKIATGAIADTTKMAANSVRTTQIADRAVWPVKINQAGASTDQYLRWNGTNWAPTFPFSGANERIPFFSGANTLTNSGVFRWVNASQQLEINTSSGNTTWATFTGGSTTANVSLRSGNPNSSTVIPGGSIVFSRAGTTPNSGNATTTTDYLGAISAQAFYGGLFRESASIQFRGDSSASTFYAGNISFLTSDGTGVAIERAKINRIGNFGIGTINPLYRLDVAGTGAIRIPSGTTAQRPIGAVGVIRLNTTTGNAEGVRSGTTYENFVMGTASTIYAGTSPSLDFPSMTQGTGSVLTFSDANAAPGDVISVGNPFASGGSYTFSAGCSTSGTIWINVVSWGSGSNDPGASTFKYTIIK